LISSAEQPGIAILHPLSPGVTLHAMSEVRIGLLSEAFVGGPRPRRHRQTVVNGML
jgi:hypothetical protein